MIQRRQIGTRVILLAAAVWTMALVWTASAAQRPASTAVTVAAANDSADEARAASAGCVTCHTRTDEATMHPSGTVTLGCATCHGGDPEVSVAAGLDME